MSTTGNCNPALERLEDRLLLSSNVLSASLAAAAHDVTLAMTGSIVEGGQLSASGADCYRFVASATGTVTLDMAANRSSLDSMMQVYNGSRVLSLMNDNVSSGNPDSRLTVSVQEGQTYYVMASAARNSSGAYNLTFRNAPNDDYGNTVQTTQKLTLTSGKAQVAGNINYLGDLDVFSMVADKTGSMTIQTGLTSQGQQCLVGLSGYSAQGQLLSGNLLADPSGSSLTLDVVKGQTYFVQVAGQSQGRGGYGIAVSTRFTGQAMNVPMADAASVQGSLTSQPCDVYRITAPSSGQIVLDMTAATGSRLDSMMQVYNADGVLMLQNDDVSGSNHNSSLTLSVQEGGTYYVVAMSSRSSSGTYSLSARNRPTDDYGDTTQTARKLTLSSDRAQITGMVNYKGDVDMFSVVAGLTGKMQVDLTTPNAQQRFNTKLVFCDAQGNVLAQTAPSGTSSTLSVDVTAGQTYYIKASAADNGTGYYQLNVSEQAQVVPPVNPAPGSVVTAQATTIAGVLTLMVMGTNGNDTITLSQTASTVLMVWSAGSQSFSGLFAAINVYGFGGNDTLRLTNTVTAVSFIDAGDGNDSVYDAATSASTINAGAGNNLMVTVGGGQATINCGTGLDSVWADSVDLIRNASAATVAANALHVISGFYQPYTTDVTSSSYVPMTIAGQNLRDPTLGSYASGYANYSADPVFAAGGPTYTDISQGALGDCYFLASLAAMADTDPGIVSQMVAPLGDGTFAVRFYRNGREVYLRVDGDLPVSGGRLSYAQLGASSSLWAPLMEKAYAFFRYGQNSYASIEGGWMGEVFTAVANSSSTSKSTTGSASTLYSFFQTSLAAGHAVTLGSYSNASGPVIGGHAYMVKSVQVIGGVSYVTVYNPWGVDGVSYDSNSSDGLLMLTIAQIQQYFSTAVADMV